ncbi:MAG: L,D-transpeptidase family protein [Lachnospiraceae bacterium]|nr:L,D-transpeptidase family protein [Lachnospiraceae bacterium]
MKMPKRPVSTLQTAKNCSQIILVQGTGGSNAVVSMHEKDSSGNWNTIFSVNGYVGRNGLGKTVEGDQKTPIGIFTMGMAFGRKDNPGTAISYTKLNNTHYWVGDSTSAYYNQFVSTDSVNGFDKSDSEHLITYNPAYNYAMDIGYNTSCTPYKGAAIFLHCFSKSSYTGGCIAIPENNMIQILNHIQVGCKILIGTKEQILTY